MKDKQICDKSMKFEECELACPDDQLDITTIASPDGTGETFTFYCAEN